MDYDPKSQVEFSDPVVRCDSCQSLIRRETIKDSGCCDSCGNRRVRNVQVIKENEMKQLKEWNIDPQFLALFEAKYKLEPTSPISCPGGEGNRNVA